MANIFSLTCHADYACRHSGACCTAGWTIPVEPERQSLLGGAWLRQDVSGACQFFDRTSRLCSIHRDHGEDAIPESCQHFPRRALVDDRGTFVTLSHYCPTAAAALVDSRDPLLIVHGPPAFPESRRYDGLDARGQWPPLLNPGVLFDLDTYSDFEAFVVETLDSSPGVGAALETIAAAVERLRQWHQRRGPFRSWAHDAFARIEEKTAVRLPGAAPSAALLQIGGLAKTARATISADIHRQVTSFVPSELDVQAVEDTGRAWRKLVAPRWGDWNRAIARYVASKGFASWSAYQGRGARTLVAEMAVSAMVLEAEACRACARADRPLDRELMIDAIRAADWLLIHLVDRQPFVDWLGEVEELGA